MNEQATQVVGYAIAESATTGNPIVVAVMADEAHDAYEPSNWFPDAESAYNGLIATLKSERDAYHAALAELVNVKAIKDVFSKDHADYKKRMPLAWQNARAVLLGRPPESTQEPS